MPIALDGGEGHGQNRSIQDSALRIEAIEAPERLHAIAPAWRDLAAHAGEPNIFYEPMAVLPALALPAAEGMTCLAAWLPCGERLAGLLPVKPWKRKNPLLLTALEAWEYTLRESADPLVRRGVEHAFWGALLPHLDRAPGGCSALRLSKLHADRACVAALHGVAERLRRPL
jgi:hypothetical protein